MAIPREKAKNQVLRLAQMVGFPNTPQALDELVRVVEQSPDEETARSGIGQIIEMATAETRCPMPAQLRSAILAARRGVETLPDPECPDCQGSGFRIVERAGLSGADRCGCWAPRKPPAFESAMPQPDRPRNTSGEMVKASEILGKGTPA